MALDLQSLSLTSAFNSIVNYFKSQENNSKWKELSTSSEGAFIIRLLANVISTLSYRIVAQSRENFLSTAALTSSNVGIAVNLGYSVFRGSNLKRLVYLTPDNSYTLPKFSILGPYNEEYSVLTLDDVELVEGVTTKIRTVVGNLKEESFTAGTSDIKIFSLFTSGISEDYILYKDGEEVPTTKVMKEMTDDKYLVRTNPYSSVDIAYLNTFDTAKYKYGTGTEFTIRYVELADVAVAPYTSSMFNYGTLEDYATISTYLPFESVDSIKVTAPLNHETQNLIRSKADYANRLAEIIPAVSEANFRALTPTFTQITYLKNNFSLLTGTKLNVGNYQDNIEVLANTEVEQVMNLLRQENFFGTPLPDIVLPRREVADLKISMALSNKYKSISDINLDIDNILRNYYNTYLNVTFNVYDLERLIENLSYVKYARVSFIINERKTNTNYQLGYLTKKGDNYYKVSKILGYTAEAEPEDGWPVPLIPGEDIDTWTVIQDGTVYWKCFKRLPNMPSLLISKRQPSGQYGIGDFMYLEQFPNYMFKCIDLVRTSGNVPPDVSNLELGDFAVDGGLVWVLTDRISDASDWSSYTQYRIGDIINVSSTSSYSLECVSYTGTTGTEDNIEFEKYEYPIVAGSQTTNSFEVEGNVTFYFRVGDTIRAMYSGGYTTFAIVSSVYDSTTQNTLITVTRYQDGEEEVIDPTKQYTSLYALERGTRDGGVLWSLIDNINKVEYDWNSFVTFSHTLEILED